MTELCPDNAWDALPAPSSPDAFNPTDAKGMYASSAYASWFQTIVSFAPTRPRNLIRETKNQWANLGG